MSPFELVANITLKSKYISLNVATAMTTASPSTEASSNDSGGGGEVERRAAKQNLIGHGLQGRKFYIVFHIHV